MINKTKKQVNKVIKIRIIPVILCILAVLTVINIMNPELHQTIHEIQIRKAYAEQEYEALIGEMGYATLEEAIEAAQANDKIVLLSDVTLDSSITINKNLSIDLSDFIIYTQGIINNAELTIENGEIYGVNETADNNVILNNGTLSIASISIRNNTGCGINNEATLNFLDEQITITAKTPIIGRVTSIRSNHAVGITTDTVNTALKVATVKNIYNTSTTEVILCQNILYSNIYDAFKSIDENTKDQVEIKMLKDITSTATRGYIKTGVDQKIVINLNGKTLTLNSSDATSETYPAGIINYGNLTIVDGTIYEYNRAHQNNGIQNFGTLNLKDANLYFQYTSTKPLYVNNQANNINVKGTVIATINSTAGKVTIDGSLQGTVINGGNNAHPELEVVSGTVNSINNYGTATIGKENTATSERPVIGRIINHRELIINNAEVIATSSYAIESRINSTFDPCPSILIKDGLIKSTGSSAIYLDCYNGHNLIIEKGEIISESTAYSTINIDRVGDGGDYAVDLTFGIDDKIVDHNSPRIEGIDSSIGLSGKLNYMDYSQWNFYDGVFVGQAVFADVEDMTRSGENEEYYAENYSTVKETSEGYVYRIKDIKAPELNNIRILTNESTYNSIKLKIDVEDTGDGLDKAVITYKNMAENNPQEMEYSFEKTEDNTYYVSLENLEQGSTYEISMIIYDKEGNSVSSNGEMWGYTTSGINSITLNPTRLTLEEGEIGNITATINPSNAINQSIEWKSSDPTVATVENGVVTAVSAGRTTITAETVDGGKTATCGVIVTESTIPVTGVTLNKTSTTLIEGGTESLSAIINPNDATNQEVQWTSSNENVATVDLNGNVIAVNEGTATITVTTEDGGYTATCTVTVTKASAPIVSVTGISLNKTVLSLVEGDTETLTATVNPSNATNKKVTWSSDSTVATVNESGKITAMGEGTATITVTTEDGGYTATCEVTVTKGTTPIVSVTGVTINKTSINLERGETETLIATVNPSNATNKDVTWSSSEASVATVDENGKVTAVGKGTATITVTTVDGGKIATCEVTVTEVTSEPDPTPDPKPDIPGDENIDLESISINKTEISLYTGESQTLKLTINPSNATIEKIIYTSSNIDVATVDENGRIMAKGKGTSTITVVVVDKNGNSLSEECKVTVKKTEVTDKEDDSDKDKDATIADKVLPSTGLGKAILAGTIVLIINGIVMLVKYRKMKDI